MVQGIKLLIFCDINFKGPSLGGEGYNNFVLLNILIMMSKHTLFS